MNLVRHSENRPGQDPQIFSSRSNQYFSNACDRLGKIHYRRAGGKNLNGSNRRTVFRTANTNANSLNHLLLNPQTDNNKIPLNSVSVFSKQAQSGGSLVRVRLVSPCLRLLPKTGGPHF